jgi:hypothetical protein
MTSDIQADFQSTDSVPLLVIILPMFRVHFSPFLMCDRIDQLEPEIYSNLRHHNTLIKMLIPHIGID